STGSDTSARRSFAVIFVPGLGITDTRPVQKSGPSARKMTTRVSASTRVTAAAMASAIAGVSALPCSGRFNTISRTRSPALILTSSVIPGPFLLVSRILNGLPDTQRRGRHLDMRDVQVGQRVGDGVDRHAQRGRRTALAAGSEAQWVAGCRNFADRSRETGEV